MRSRLRRSTPSGGGAGGCCRTGATHHGPAPSPLSRRHPTQRLPWMMGADQRCSVLSRSSRMSPGRGAAALAITGTTSALGDTSHSATVRPARATLAWRSTSRRRSSLVARLGRAAFVALRLIDLLAPDGPALPRDAFHYQHAATDRACRGLPADRPETSHLIGVVQSTADAYHTRDVGLLFHALFAYAHYLEDEMCLEEALDVLETLERVGGDKYRAEDRVAARLRVARVLRKVNRFDEAERAYDEAGALAEGISDAHSGLLSRIGH